LVEKCPFFARTHPFARQRLPCPFDDANAARDPREMKQVEKRKHCDSKGSSPQAPALRRLDPDVIRFVEALAIADARRDHLVAAQMTAIDGRAAKDLSSQVEASTNDSCGHLRSILD
jgi:hypothetical protein